MIYNIYIWFVIYDLYWFMIYDICFILIYEIWWYLIYDIWLYDWLRLTTDILQLDLKEGATPNLFSGLLTCLFCVRYHEVSREDGSYNASAARKRGFQYIGVIDRSELLAYIEGSNENFEKIVPEVDFCWVKGEVVGVVGVVFSFFFVGWTKRQKLMVHCWLIFFFGHLLRAHGFFSWWWVDRWKVGYDQVYTSS